MSADGISTGLAKARYRPDIDGLRAVAVLLVLFNHVGMQRFPGGFIGVDVFFVISGYLISGILLRDIGAGKFSIATFYERRFRRIMPALLAVLVATSALAYVYLFPFDLNGFAQTQLGALLSVANIVLLHQVSYFDAARKLKPLLHTWSLGVEEQFYIVFPLVLLALVKWGRKYLNAILWVLTAIGFALALYWLPRNAMAAFYLAPLRAWELLCGILLAAGAVPALDQPWKRNGASAFGLLLIVWAGVRYQDFTPFPGWHALPPCLGALLILAAGEKGTSLVGEVLSWKPIRWIGLISYSLYLWHWPIQVFQTMANILVPDRYPTWVAKAAVIVVSLIVAALSWRFIEQPFRVGRLRAHLPLFAINGVVFALLIGFSAWIVHTDGWLTASAPKSALRLAFVKASPVQDQIRWKQCYVDPADFDASYSKSVCLSDDAAKPHYLLMGDSHAAHAWWGLQTGFAEVNLSEMAVTGCAPIFKHPAWQGGMCDHSTDFIFNDYLVHHPVDTVVLIAKWDDWSAAHLGETIDWIRQHGMKAVVIGPSIQFDASLVRLLDLAQRQHDPALLARHRDVAEQTRDAAMQRMARDVWHVPYISMYEDLCTPQMIAHAESASGCPVRGVNGAALVWDTDHLSPDGGLLLAHAIREKHQLP